ncbi:MAG: AzlD domain-containing protein [Actinomycetaceae bacterium]|nr:AzlD domain-containing protein [Arcanobacterium sp.]MDD7687051.1 AzlD domain-containing protein [Actinomycetaceae bacterium]MDY5273292.1 AzlD domain-containing protein [Arcanobacterium sp.]
MWWWILAACAIAFATKLVGFLVPEKVLERPAVEHVAAVVTVGLLASLVATNAFSSGHAVVLDARCAALAVAVVALSFRVPFLAVVILGAAVSAGMRAFVPSYYEPQVSAVALIVALGIVALHAARDMRTAHDDGSRV